MQSLVAIVPIVPIRYGQGVEVDWKDIREPSTSPLPTFHVTGCSEEYDTHHNRNLSWSSNP